MSTERLAQSETYYPGYQEAHSGVTAIAFGIRRVSDGQWYDFNDSTFKASGWATKHQALAEDDDGLWTYDTGWAIPDSDTVYHLQWKITDATGTYQELGPKIIVNSSLLDVLADWINGGRLDLLLDAIKAKTDNQPAGIPKNVALSNFEFLMVLSSDHITPATGKTLTGEISKDGGSFAACSNAATEIANGVYKINLTQDEMNADIITLKFTETNCDQRTITIKTSA